MKFIFVYPKNDLLFYVKLNFPGVEKGKNCHFGRILHQTAESLEIRPY